MHDYIDDRFLRWKRTTYMVVTQLIFHKNYLQSFIGIGLIHSTLNNSIVDIWKKIVNTKKINPSSLSKWINWDSIVSTLCIFERK